MKKRIRKYNELRKFKEYFHHIFKCCKIQKINKLVQAMKNIKNDLKQLFCP